MDHAYETAAIRHALKHQQKEALTDLRGLNDAELDLFIDALDWLTSYADAEAIRRVEKRPTPTDGL